MLSLAITIFMRPLLPKFISCLLYTSGITTYMMTPDKDYGQLVSDKVFMYRPKHTGGFEVMGVEEVKAKFDIQSPTPVSYTHLY